MEQEEEDDVQILEGVRVVAKDPSTSTSCHVCTFSACIMTKPRTRTGLGQGSKNVFDEKGG